MSTVPRVSVITIFWNAENFIAEALESVIAQTFDAWELVLVDDGSTDASTMVARQYVEPCPDRVRYVEHPLHAQCGTGASRNLGIQHARGEFIAFLDADDVLRPDALADQVAALDANTDVGMVYGPIEHWYSWREAAEQSRDVVYPLGVPANRVIAPPQLLVRFLQRRAAVPSSALMIRRAVVERVGGFEKNFESIFEDQAFCAKVCLTTPVYASSESYYRYRQHPDSLCAVARRRGGVYAARGFFYNWLESYLRAQGFQNTDVWRILQKEKRAHRQRGFARHIRQLHRLPRRLRARLRDVGQ